MKPVLHYLVSNQVCWTPACGVAPALKPLECTDNPVAFALDTAPDAEFQACPGCEGFLNGTHPGPT